MLLSVKFVIFPPLTFIVSPSLRVTFVPVSPAKVSGWLTAVFNALKASPTLRTVVVVPVPAGLVTTV